MRDETNCFQPPSVGSNGLVGLALNSLRGVARAATVAMHRSCPVGRGGTPERLDAYVGTRLKVDDDSIL